MASKRNWTCPSRIYSFPTMVGGGVVFGPTPRSYSYSLPKKVRRLAIKSALSTKVQSEEFVVVEDLKLDAPKTKEMVNILSGLSASDKALVVTADYNEAVALSAKNIPGVTFVTADNVSVLDLLKHNKVVITKEAVEKVEEVLG